MNITNLFPTPVGHFSFHRELTEAELSFVKEQPRVNNEGNTNSKNNRVFDNAELKDLYDWVDACTREYFQQVHRPSGDTDIYITQSWLNYTQQKQYHHKHNHSCSFISGCFYVQTDDETDKIYFYGDRKQHDLLQITPTDYNIWNSASWWLPVKTGELILFPSHLTHMVAEKEAPGERISLAFNTFLKGQLGNDDSLTGLYLNGK